MVAMVVQVECWLACAAIVAPPTVVVASSVMHVVAGCLLCPPSIACTGDQAVGAMVGDALGDVLGDALCAASCAAAAPAHEPGSYAPGAVTSSTTSHSL